MDYLQTFPLYRGKGCDDTDDHVGHVKGAIRLYPQKDVRRTVLSDIHSPKPIDVLVRVYIVEVSRSYFADYTYVYMYALSSSMRRVKKP